MAIDGPDAVVREIDGQLVPEDPTAVAVIAVVEQHNRMSAKQQCRATLDANRGRVEHFTVRIAERRMSPDEVVIVVIRVDDDHGGPLADALMPGTNWQEFRDRGEEPFARGLAGRDGIQEILTLFDPEAAAKLRETSVAVVVVDHGVAEVFAIE